MLHPQPVSRQGIGAHMYQQVARVRHDEGMNKQPKYRQVADALRREIVNGTHAPGARLPSESDLQQRFEASRNTIRNGLSLLVSEGLISSSQGLGYEVKSQEVFELNASRFENLTFPQNGDAYNTDVTNAGRRPHQTFRVEMLPASQEIAERLKVEPSEKTVLRFCHRYVDDVPWSTQATYYPSWLVDASPRLAEPGDIAEGTTRYLAAQGIEQVGYFDEIAARMPTPEEARLLEIGAGVPVMLWTRTGYSADRPIRCTITTFRGDLNRMNYEIGNLAARNENT
jgi:GntR family transcriptional regulator